LAVYIIVSTMHGHTNIKFKSQQLYNISFQCSYIIHNHMQFIHTSGTNGVHHFLPSYFKRLILIVIARPLR